MADQLLRTHPLEAWTAAFAALPDSLRITAEPFVSMADVRVPPAVADQFAIHGLPLPTEPNTWTPTADGQLVWLGPDEWLLTSTGTSPDALEEELRDQLRPVGGTAVDVSAQRIGVRISGPRARAVLANGCAQTTLGQAGVVLLSLGEDEFAVLVRSSFAGYLATWLLDAGLEYVPLG
jgi:sarcosine oxidase subunit gamma